MKKTEMRSRKKQRKTEKNSENQRKTEKNIEKQRKTQKAEKSKEKQRKAEKSKEKQKEKNGEQKQKCAGGAAAGGHYFAGDGLYYKTVAQRKIPLTPLTEYFPFAE